MKKIQTVLLAAAVACALPLAASAQDRSFDDRWYLTGSTGFNFQDSQRGTDDAPFVTLGVGKFVSPNWSVDGELNYQNPNFDANKDLNWSQYGVSIDARRHFVRDGRGWNPYVLMGVGYQKSEEEYVVLGPNSPRDRKDGNVSAKLGLGLQTTFEKRVAVRAEVAYRADFDDQAINPRLNGRDESWYGDVLASVGVVIPLGAAPVAATPPAPPAITPAAPSCAELDDDGDGVNNCDDRCPDSRAGQTIGADGCPVPVSIDLKGVNFDFDKSTLRADSRAILDDALGILERYPDMKVEVAGHTDSVGSEQYNQGLSERRAKAVYDYLTSHGISADRLVGPTGYGETRPIAPNDTAEGRAQNRRTELNVEN